MKAPRIRLHFNVSEPVELVEMTLAFQGIGYEYQSYIRGLTNENGGKRNIGDVKLYITKIESNCILAELAPALPYLSSLAPVFSDINTICDFVKNTGETINWLIEASKKETLSQENIHLTKRKVNNTKDIVKMIGKNKGSNLGLHALRYEESSGEDSSVLEISFSASQCREAEKGANRVLHVLDSKEGADKEKVLMYFFQTNTDDPKTIGRTGDKALISSISNKPLSVYVIPEVAQQRIRYVLDDKTHNPLHTGFVVDVNIENDRKGLPRIYRVIRLHDVIYDDDE